MGMAIMIFVFGTPLFLIFWASSAQITRENWIAGFALMILVVILFSILFFVMSRDNDEKQKNITAKIDKKNDSFGEEIKNAYGACFLLKNGTRYLLFDANKHNEFSGYVTMHYNATGENRTIMFESIENCILYKSTKTIKRCSVNNPCFVTSKSFSFKYALEIQEKNNFIMIESNDIRELEQIYNVVEYIITKGKSTKSSPFLI